MTTLVFNSGTLTVATDAWMATTRTEISGCLVQVYAPKGDCGRLTITMDEFLELIAEGGKAVDLRGFQASK